MYFVKMPEDKPNPKKPSLTDKFYTNIFPPAVAVALGAALLVPLYLRYVDGQNFLKKEVVTLRGNVVGERYTSQIESGVGCGGSYSHNEYFFSLDDPVQGRIGIEVLNSHSPRLLKESIDAKLERGTRVVVKARNIAPGEYRAFAAEVHPYPVNNIIF